MTNKDCGVKVIVMETITLTNEELQQLEWLLKKLHEVDVHPYNGVTSQKWQDDVIVAIEDSKKRQVRVKR